MSGITPGLPAEPASAFGLAALFIGKLAWSALFGLSILAAIVISERIWQPDWALSRYDGLFLFAIGTQILFLLTRLETWAEVKVIFLFHITGTVMEIYKLAQGSWDYPDQGVMEIGGVPMFTGFMYGAVGSFIARAIHVFQMRFAPYPPLWQTFLFAGLIYANFFTHHYLPDIRIALFAGSLLLFWRTRIWFTLGTRARAMRLPVAALFCGGCLWLAENIGTLTQTWAYPGQGQFETVRIAMLGSWYLLLYVSFVTVTLILRDHLVGHPLSRSQYSDQREATNSG